MSDVISRKEAIEALLEKGQRSRRYKLGEIWELNFDEIREVLNSLPSAVPTPHGRLIDADALIENANFYETEMEAKEAPTVIEAEADHVKTVTAKIVTNGNCCVCGKPLDSGLFLCKKCAAHTEGRS